MKNILIIIVVLTLFACAANNIENWSTDKKMTKADEYYAEKNYRKAIDLYKLIVFERHSALTPDAQMKLGNCYMYRKEYEDARFEFTELIRLFPDYKNISDAYYHLASCYLHESLDPQYSQDETLHGIEALSNFVDNFPNDNRKAQALADIQTLQAKLIEKTYDNGYIYYRLKDYSASLMYLDEVLALDHNDSINKNALYFVCLIHIERGHQNQAQAVLDTLTRKYAQSKKTRRALSKFNRKFNK